MAFSESKLISGQRLENVAESHTIYTFINQARFINFGFTDENPFNSNEVSTTEIGLQDVSMFKGTVLYEFNIKNTLHCLDNISNIYSNVLKAEPKNVIVNKTSLVLEVAQIDVESKSVKINQGERANWVWPLKT